MEKTHNKLNDDRTGKLLINLSAPAMLGMFANALYNITDTIFIGRGIGALGIGAMTIVLPIVGISNSFAHMVGSGSASIFSRSLGARKYDELNTIAGNSLMLIVLISLFFSIMGSIFTTPVLRFFGATKNILPYATDYARIIFITMLWFPFCVTSGNLLRAEGNAKEAMKAMLLGLSVNTLLDYVFIFPLDMGMKGAALATAAGMGANFLYQFFYFHSSKTILNLKLKHFKLQKKLIKEMTSIGLSGLGMRSSGSISVLILNHTLARLGGDMAIAIFGVIYRVALFIVMPLNGLSQGMQPIVGYNAGAQNPKRIEKTIRLGLLYALGIGLFFVAISEWFASPLFALFTGKENMIHEGIPALRIVLSMMWLAGIPIAILGIHQALGLKKSAFFLAIMRWLLLIVPISFLLPVFFKTPINGIWWAFPIADFLGTFIALGILLRTLYLHGIIHKKII